MSALCACITFHTSPSTSVIPFVHVGSSIEQWVNSVKGKIHLSSCRVYAWLKRDKLHVLGQIHERCQGEGPL